MKMLWQLFAGLKTGYEVSPWLKMDAHSHWSEAAYSVQLYYTVEKR